MLKLVSMLTGMIKRSVAAWEEDVMTSPSSADYVTDADNALWLLHEPHYVPATLEEIDRASVLLYDFESEGLTSRPEDTALAALAALLLVRAGLV